MIRRQIYTFIKENYNGYFISIQLPIALRNRKRHIVEKYLKYVLSKFEKHLQGGSKAWIKHPYRFIGFYENHFEQTTWHIHLLGSFINPLTNERIPLEKMYDAMEKANNKFIRRYKTRYGLEYDIQLVNSIPRTFIYCTKELLFKGFLESDRIISSEILFEYHKKTHKRPTKARLKQKHINNTCPKATTRSTIHERLSYKYQVTSIEKSKYHAWSQYKKQKPTEIELQQKAIISRYNRIKIKMITLRTQNAS